MEDEIRRPIAIDCLQMGAQMLIEVNYLIASNLKLFLLKIGGKMPLQSRQYSKKK